MEDHIIEQFFESVEHKRYQLCDKIRDKVRFDYLNLAQMPYPETLAGIDFVFYRNVSIYFEADMRENIFRNLAGLLTPGGYLFVSSTETLAHDLGILPLVETDGIFLFQKPLAKAEKKPAQEPVKQEAEGREADKEIKLLIHEDHRDKYRLPAYSSPFSSTENRLLSYTEEDEEEERENSRRGVLMRSLLAARKARLERESEAAEDEGRRPGMAIWRNFEEKPVHQPLKAEASDLFEQARELAEKKLYQEALDILKHLSEIEMSAPALTLKASILINLERSKEAGILCFKALEINPLWDEAHILLGLIAKSQEKWPDAQQCFKKALYIRPATGWPTFIWH